MKFLKRSCYVLYLFQNAAKVYGINKNIEQSKKKDKKESNTIFKMQFIQFFNFNFMIQNFNIGYTPWDCWMYGIQIRHKIAFQSSRLFFMRFKFR